MDYFNRKQKTFNKSAIHLTKRMKLLLDKQFTT